MERIGYILLPTGSMGKVLLVVIVKCRINAHKYGYLKWDMNSEKGEITMWLLF